MAEKLHRYNPLRRRCPMHKSIELSMACDTCNGQLVCVRCATSSHQGHFLYDVREYCETRKTRLEDLLALSETKIRDMDKQLHCVVTKKEKTLGHFENLFEKISRRAEVLKRYIDQIGMELIYECKKLQKVKGDLFVQVEDNFHKCIAGLKDSTKKCRETLDAGSSTDVRKSERELNTWLKGATVNVPGILLDIFVPGRDTYKNLKSVFGKILTVKDPDVVKYTGA